MSYKLKKNGQILTEEEQGNEIVAFILIIINALIIYGAYVIVGVETSTEKAILTVIGITSFIVTFKLRDIIMAIVGLIFLALIGYGVYLWIVN